VADLRDTLVRTLWRADLGGLGLLLGAHKFLRHLVYFTFLDARGFQLVTDLYYERHRFYFEEEHNARGLFPWEERVLERHFSGVRSVLVTSAGGGREVLAFARKGYRVVGTENHAGLCKTAEARLAGLPNARVLSLPPRDLPAGEPLFDAAVLGWGGYSHMAPRAQRIAFLRKVRGGLQPGGRLLVSYLGRKPGAERTVSVARAVTRPLRRVCGYVAVEPGDGITLGFVHRFLPGEAAREAEEAGFAALEESVASGGAVGDAYPYLVARSRGEPEIPVEEKAQERGAGNG
jgi:SAM-dependent methyltransferase